ncbi:MAG TPA: hypothetical protein VFM30_11470 [Steroidobacteraceae bacterium]|jgi:hypothetical protein|nr:hypothetical protein [Steroidobacteraceae bacterium]
MMPSLPRRAALHGLLALVASALAATPALAQRGALTLPRNLSQLVEGSADIVRGTVTSARVEKHPQLPHLDTIVVTLRVDETIKGAPAKTYTFRQYIWDIRDREDRAGYFKGQSYLLLMNAPSRFGLTSPVGMDQGRFRLKRDAAGRQFAVNGRGNAELMRGVPESLARRGATLTPAAGGLAQKHQRGPIATDDLVQLIREIARTTG